MVFYFINVAIIGILFFLISHIKCKKSFFLVLSLFYLYFVASLRDIIIGTDYNAYVTAFNTIATTGTYYMEKGYVFLNKIVLLFSNHYSGVAFAVNALLLTSLYFYLVRNVDSNYLGICFFVFLLNPYMFMQSTFNIMRQACATGIMLFGITLILNRKSLFSFFVYSMLVVISAQFHRSSYAMIIIPLIVWFPWRRFVWLLVFLFSHVVRFIGLERILSLFVGNIGFRSVYSSYEPSLLNHPVYVLLISLVFLYVLYRYNDYSKLGVKEKRIINLFLFSLCFLFVALTNDMIYRIYIFLAYFSIPAFAIIIKTPSHQLTCNLLFKEEGIILLVSILAYYFFFFSGYVMYLNITNNIHYIPYRLFF